MSHEFDGSVLPKTYAYWVVDFTLMTFFTVDLSSEMLCHFHKFGARIEVYILTEI